MEKWKKSWGEYFDEYKTPGMHVEINQLLEDEAGVFKKSFARRFKGKPVDLLLLGSATPRNVAYLRKFLGSDVGVLEKESSITLIDSNQTPIEMHKEYASAHDEGPKLRVVGGDVRAYPFKGGSFDMIFSDYTTSFLGKEKDWSDFFGEIGQALRENGRAVVVCFFCPDEGIPPLLHNEEWGVWCVSSDALSAMIQSAGLVVEHRHDRSARREYEGHKSKVATLVLRRGEREITTPPAGGRQ